VLLIHGSATDHGTWSIQLASPVLTAALELVAYDRHRAPVGATSVGGHAEDAAALLGEGPAVVVGSSFGAVVALELARRYPARALGLVLIEPPMGPSDEAPSAPAGWLAGLDQVATAEGPAAAAERFLRAVLGDEPFERMPRAFQDRARARWDEIRADCAALIAYRPGYATLGEVGAPTLLLGGVRSAPSFAATLDALAAALPRARRERVAGAGHMLHAEAHRRFAELLRGFVVEVAAP
jgi:pimeloyl-ACP methyl ester carboxylesterase